MYPARKMATIPNTPGLKSFLPLNLKKATTVNEIVRSNRVTTAGLYEMHSGK
jgi:hypothetical protein